ncbi:TPT domain-containing protein [Mycena kentingensis (nom. inval.)]|nr:TPT domain-containing protein [Mycena kentingensis (nom. inval.)]
MPSSSRRPCISSSKPLLPPRHALFASNAADGPMQTLKLPSAPLLIDIPSKQRDVDAPRVALRADRSLRLSSGTLYQRAYHHEPYPDSSNQNGIESPSPTELTLPPFASPTSPKLKSPPFAILLPQSSTFWLSMYFCFNLGLTLYNKSVLVRFPFPYTLSALHACFGTIGASFLAKHGYFTPSRLNLREAVVLVGFSALYTVNIVVSNISLQLVTIPFHQVVRAATPIFTILFSAILFGAQSSSSKKISLVPVVAGVGFATFGDYYFTYIGLLLTLLGTLLAAFKTIFTNVLQSPTAVRPAYFRNPFDLLYYLSPLALVECLLLAHATGELERVQLYAAIGEMSRGKVMALALNGCIAFGLNVVSFSANRKVGALGMTVASNVKQVLTIVFAVFIFDLTITTLNAVGIGLTLVGGAWYAWIELVEKRDAPGMNTR